LQIFGVERCGFDTVVAHAAGRKIVIVNEL